jgi:hypothetical protein
VTSFNRKADPQSDSTNLRQLGLRLSSQNAVSVDFDSVCRQKTFNAAIVLCVQSSGLDRKQVYSALGVDAATWSRIESGQAHFPVNKLEQLMDLCLNEAPLMWLIHARGYDWSSVRRKQSEVEKALTEMQQENADLKRLLRLKGEAGL